MSRVGNIRQKNNSAEDGIDGTNGYFRRNSGCSAEQKLSEFRSEPAVEEKTTRNSVLWIKNRGSLSEFRSEPFRGRETTRASVLWNKNRGNSRNVIPNHSVEEETQNKARLLRVVHRIYYLPLLPPQAPGPSPSPHSPVLNNFFVAEQLDCFEFPGGFTEPNGSILAIPPFLNCISLY